MFTSMLLPHCLYEPQTQNLTLYSSDLSPYIFSIESSPYISPSFHIFINNWFFPGHWSNQNIYQVYFTSFATSRSINCIPFFSSLSQKSHMSDSPAKTLTCNHNSVLLSTVKVREALLQRGTLKQFPFLKAFKVSLAAMKSTFVQFCHAKKNFISPKESVCFLFGRYWKIQYLGLSPCLPLPLACLSPNVTFQDCNYQNSSCTLSFVQS